MKRLVDFTVGLKLALFGPETLFTGLGCYAASMLTGGTGGLIELGSSIIRRALGK